MEINMKSYPYVTGTFLQPGAFVKYDEAKWTEHFGYLKEVGIDTIIIQWTSETPYGEFISAYYPEEFKLGQKSEKCHYFPDFTEALLSAAQKCNVKVFVGLNLSDEWWKGAQSDRSWRENQSSLGEESAKRLYSLYKEKYPDAFYGWYFGWECYNGMPESFETADFLNSYLDPLTKLDPTMPLLLSPFVRRVTTPEETEKEWAGIFKNTRFRKGDIFCCQDAVGAGHIDIEMMDSYFNALKNACDVNENIIFWANNENFTLEDNNGSIRIYSGEVERFVRQMNIASKYVKGYVTFAYSHYYSPDKGNSEYHEAYKKYYLTGAIS